jgi:CRISPR-associated protein (TIGR02584 family)
MKHVFLASLGGSPQVVTETLWALMHPDRMIDQSHRTRQPIVPSIVHLVATSFFNERMFACIEARNTAIKERITMLFLQHDKPAPEVVIDELKDGQSKLKDIRTQRENIVYANHITRVVMNYAQRGDTVIHMSLAGGRKSMSSYDHSAMMFFGRVDDELSHVLVEPEILERTSDFWWPDQTERIVQGPNGVQVPTSSDLARVDLVNVPFVRLKVRLPKGVPPEAIDHERLVEFVEFERRADPIIVSWNDKLISVGGQSIPLEPLHFMFFCVLALARVNKWPGAGPPDEGIGQNSAGWILLDDIRCGIDENGRRRTTRPLAVFDSLRSRPELEWDGRTHRESSRGDSDSWFDQAKRTQVGRVGEEDSTKEFRAKTKRALKDALHNPFIETLILPNDYRTDKGKCLGLGIDPSRLQLIGFTESEHNPF